MILDIKKLSFYYDTKYILKNLDVEFRSGLLNIISGKNGSGKSTFLKIIATLLSPITGKIYYDGVELKQFKQKFRERVGYIDSNSSLYPQFTFKEHIDFFSKIFSNNFIPKKIDIFPIDRKISTLSTGEKQLAQLILLSFFNYDFYIFDEVNTTFDNNNQKFFWDFIKNRIDLDKMVFIVMHNIDKFDLKEIPKKYHHLKMGKFL